MFNEDDRSLCLCREVKPEANVVQCDHCPMWFHLSCLVEAAEAALVPQIQAEVPFWVIVKLWTAG